MKKLLIYLITLALVGLIGTFVLYGGWIFPVEDISGCYTLTTKKYVDKLCLYPNGQYEQFYAESGTEFEKYNSNTWRSFPHSNDLGDFIAGSLNQFVTRDDEGVVDSLSNIDIQPHQDIFGNVLFARGMNSSSEWKEYYRE
ncbi:hypothetical protein [Zooshikella ganghwensis]|uniref:hypothetical protein n=1 Tax=Zooshikella ganghwensis TaxID=202772 RepID=UPI00041B0D16|nr:hypothetical protein [Zooshikella ganghwensis]